MWQLWENEMEVIVKMEKTNTWVEGGVIAQYVNCAAANSGADAGMYDASSEIYKLSTWQHVPHRGNPFRDKGGLRGQRQSGSCSKRHHVTREEDFSGRQRVFETLHDCTSISQPT